MNTESPSPMTPLDICNLALCKLGETPLSAIDPNGNPASRLCYMHYHPVRREVLCSARWAFATRCISLTSAEVSGDDDHAVAHTLPPDCLRVLRVNHSRWTLCGRVVFCPAGTIRITYTTDTEDTALFEPLFIEALAVRLACKLCIPLVNSSTARQALLEEYRRITLPQAAYVSAVQSHSNDSDPLYELLNHRKKIRLL